MFYYKIRFPLQATKIYKNGNSLTKNESKSNLKVKINYSANLKSLVELLWNQYYEYHQHLKSKINYFIIRLVLVKFITAMIF